MRRLIGRFLCWWYGSHQLPIYRNWWGAYCRRCDRIVIGEDGWLRVVRGEDEDTED